MNNNVDQFIEQLQSGSDEERKNAALALGDSGETAAIEPLETALNDSAMGVRYFARKSLSKLRKKLAKMGVAGRETALELTPSAAETPTNSLDEFRGLVPDSLFSLDPGDRVDALANIVETDLPIAGQAVVVLLESEESPRVTATAVKALATLTGRDAVKRILPFLKDGDDRVRANTVEALQIAGDPAVTEHIIPLLEDSNHRVRANTVTALHAFGQEVIPILQDMLSAPEEWMRASAAHALSYIKDERVDLLIWKACDDSTEDVRQMGYIALLTLAQRNAARSFIGKLGETLEDPESSQQVCAIRIRKNLEKFSESGIGGQRELALRLLSDLSVKKVRELIDILQSGSEEERKNAALALGDLIAPEAVQPLEDALQDKSRGVRYFVRKSLAKLRRKLAAIKQENVQNTVFTGSVLPEAPEADVLESHIFEEVRFPEPPGESSQAAIELLHSDNVDERIQALSIIAESPPPGAVEIISDLLASDEDKHVRATALKVLATIGGDGVAHTIEPYLQDEDHRVRANAVEALEIAGDPDYIEQLVPLLKDEDHRVRANTTRALHAFGMTGVFPVLEEMLRAPEESMRVSAAHALGFLEDEGVYPLLWRACEDESPDVQKMAFDSLLRISDRGTASLFLQEMAEAMKNPDSDKHHVAQNLYQNVVTIMERGSLEEKNLALELVGEITTFLKASGAIDLLIEMYTVLVDLHPDVKRLITLGNLYLQQGDLVNARIQFDRYLAIDPGNVPIRMKLGEISFFTGDLEKAEEEYARALKLSPESPAILYKVGEVRFLAGKNQEAVSTFQRLVKMETSLAPHAHNLLGLSYIRMQFPEMARKEFESLDFDTLDLSENQAKEMLYRIAAAYFEHGYYKDSLDFFKRIMGIDVEYRDVANRVEELKALITRGPAADKERGDSTSGVLGGSDVENLSKMAKNRYTDIKLLGEGGMGRVYQARDTLLDRLVAVKVLPMPLAREKKIRERFTREARASARMSHPNIVQVYDVNPGKFPFFVMEFINGKSFRELIKLKKFLAHSALKNLVLQMAEAFQYAHDRGVVHRDIKPDNIMLDFHGQVKIMDFGLAKMEMVSELTQQGEIMGTVYYMSPEQIKGKKVDHRTDVYSFGITLYEVMTKLKPFREGNVMYEHLNATPEPPSSINASIPKPVENAVLKCMEKEPEDRYQSFRDFIQDWLVV